MHTAAKPPSGLSRIKRIAISIGVLLIVFAVTLFIAFRVSPWPYALLIRRTFTEGALKTNKALEKHVPDGVSSILNEHYDPNDPDAYLDVYFPAALVQSGRSLPVVVWVHGGGWVSGNKEQADNYYKILASKGYTVVAIDYSIAPEQKYPTPVKQTNAALAYLSTNAQRLHINASCFILAGDSGGAHIVAQEANVLSVASFAGLLGIKPAINRSQLAGVLLFCGPYDARNVDMEGDFGQFLKTILWSYSGVKDFTTNPDFATASVIEYVTGDFPPAFISAGNGDPLLPHSLAMAEKLAGAGVLIDTLFFPATYAPAQPHEYQFNLDDTGGRLALERATRFLAHLDCAKAGVLSAQ
jgi:acetyl esterase